MALVLGEILFIMFLIRKFDVRKKILVVLGISLQIAVILAYRLELVDLWNREVYWSDSQMYWEASEKLLKYGKIPNVYNIGYVLYVYIVRLTSPFMDALMVNVSNILLAVLSILMISEMLRENSKYYLPFTLINPFIGYSLGRNLKDSLFLFVVALYALIFAKSSRFGKFLSSVIFAVLIIFIRPWGPVVMILALSMDLIFNSKNISKILVNTVLLFVAISIVMVVFAHHLEVWVPVLLERMRTFGISSVLKAPFRLLLGPGPIRSLFSKDFFMFYTNTGSIFLTLGSFIWWLYLPFLVAWMVKNGIDLKRPITIAVLSFIAVYSVAYAGTGEIRFRGVLYVLLPGMVLLRGSFSRDLVRWYILFLPLMTIPAIFLGVNM